MERRVGLYAAIAALTVILVHRRASQRKIRHPPSPASLPLLGNLLAIPPGLDHLAYIKLGKELNSDIVYLKLLGNEIVVLNSAEAASDLLDKRSALYSDRFCPPMLKEPDLFDWSNNFGMSGYNDLWRHYRRMMNNWLNPQAVTQFNGLQERQTHLLLRQLLGVSGQPMPFEHVKNEFFFTMASSMFKLAYGYQLKGRKDPFFVNLLQAMNNGMNAVMLTNFYVNLFPALARVPDWFPGTRWKQTIRAWREHKDRALDEPYEWTRAQVEAGVAEPSIIGSLLQEHSLTEGLSVEERDRRLRELGMATFAGGTDTAANTLVCFVAAMVMNPHIQAKAQHEIDTILGPNTLPTLSDRTRLPYVNRLILEVSRWHPVSPTAIPHVCLQDDIYRGYDISKGTVVIGNLWAISRDERFYPDPETFDPDRFLDKTVPPFPVFGWGRRICPGLHFGEASLFITISSLLSAFTFFKKQDEFGREIEPKLVGASNAVVLELEPFEFDFKPRSDGHRLLIQDST